MSSRDRLNSLLASIKWQIDQRKLHQMAIETTPSQSPLSPRDELLNEYRTQLLDLHGRLEAAKQELADIKSRSFLITKELHIVREENAKLHAWLASTEDTELQLTRADLDDGK